MVPRIYPDNALRNLEDLQYLQHAAAECLDARGTIASRFASPLLTQRTPAMTAIWKGSPNKTKSRGGFKPEAVVIHIMEGTLRGTDAWFANPASKVSAHYGIGKDGTIHQYVLEADQAWHAGRVYSATWAGLRRGVSPNRNTIGIEHEGTATDVWPEAMLKASAELIRDICARWAIPIDRAHVVGHREIYARKTCPGVIVDLDALVARAHRLATGASPASSTPTSVYNDVDDPGPVVTRIQLNVRAAPTAEAKKLRSVPAGTTLDAHGWTSNGQAVSGNAHWYRLADRTWVWAGGTLAPVPAIGGRRCP